MSVSQTTTLVVTLDSTGVTRGSAAAASALGDLKTSSADADNALKGVKTASVQAAVSADQLRDAISADTAKLKELSAQMRNLKGHSEKDKVAIKALGSEFSLAKNRIATSTKSLIDMGESLNVAQTPLQALLGNVKEMPGPIGQMTQHLMKVSKVFGNLSIVTLASAAAFAVITIAAAVAAVKLTEWAVSNQDAARSAQLHLQGVAALSAKFQAAGGSAEQLRSAIEAVTATTPLDAAKVTTYAEQLAQAGLAGATLQTALEAVATTAAAGGDTAANAQLKTITALGNSGKAIDALAAKTKEQLGGIAAAQMLSLEVQAKKLEENLGKLSSGIKIDGLLKARAAFLSMFSESAAEGKALRTLLEGLVQPLVDATEAALPSVRKFFDGVLIGLLQMQYAFYATKDAFYETILNFYEGGGAKVERFFRDTLPDAMAAGEVAVWAIGAAMTYLAVQTAIATWPLLLAVGALWGLWQIGKLVYTLFDELGGTFAENAGNIGLALMDGITGGMTSGAIKMLKLGTEIGGKLVTLFKNLWGVHSPSTVMEELGGNLTAGLQLGIDDGKVDVQHSLDDLTPNVRRIEVTSQTPEIPATTVEALDMRGAAGATDRAVTLSIEHLTVNVDGAGQDPATQGRTIAANVADELERIFLGMTLQVGSPA